MSVALHLVRSEDKAEARADAPAVWELLGVSGPDDNPVYYRDLLSLLAANPERLEWILSRWEAGSRTLCLKEEDQTSKCCYPGCRRPWNRARLCPEHSKTFQASGTELTSLRWAAEQEPVVWESSLADCEVDNSLGSCLRPAHTKGLCAAHYGLAKRLELSEAAREIWITTAKPYPHPGGCQVDCCEWKALRESSDGTRALCPIHEGRWRHDLSAALITEKDFEQWQSREEPADNTDYLRFWLGGLPETVSLEVMCALAFRQPGDPVISLNKTRAFIRLCRSLQVSSIQRATAAPESGKADSAHHLRTVWEDRISRALAVAEHEWERDILRAKVIDPSGPDTRLNLAAVRQPWLREMLTGLLQREWTSVSMSHKMNWVRHAGHLSESLWN